MYQKVPAQEINIISHTFNSNWDTVQQHTRAQGSPFYAMQSVTFKNSVLRTIWLGVYHVIEESLQKNLDILNPLWYMDGKLFSSTIQQLFKSLEMSPMFLFRRSLVSS